MAKDDQKPAEAPITRDELLSVVRELVAKDQLTADKIRDLVTTTTIEAYDKTSGKFWDERNFPRISAFNPLGDREHPRDQIIGEVFWLGHLLQREELTQPEIALLNQLEPGRYGPEGSWVVIDRSPGSRDRSKRSLLVLFPCKDEDARMRLPQGDFLGRRSGMEQMLELMVQGMPAAV